MSPPHRTVAVVSADNPHQASSLLDKRSNPQDGHSANDGCSQLSEQSTPGDAQLFEQPASNQTAKESKYEIHNEAEASTFHQLTSAKASQTSNND